MSDATPLDGGTPGVFDAEPAKPVEPTATGGTARSGREDARRASAYRGRFTALYIALALGAGLAIGAFVMLLLRPAAGPGPAWSAWRPTGSETAEVRQIADHVAKKYRADSGRQLVAVIPSVPKVTGSSGDVPVSAIAVRPDTSTGKKEENQIDIIPASNSYQYILCGLGTNCSIKGGKPSVARHALLRREALELALYTFRYVDGIDSVSVFLPPRPDGAAAATSVFLRRSDLRPELARPLTSTIGTATPKIGKMSKRELALVNRITEPRLYSYEYQQAQDGSAVLVYDPIVLGA